MQATDFNDFLFLGFAKLYFLVIYFLILLVCPSISSSIFYSASLSWNQTPNVSFLKDNFLLCS